MLISLSTLGCGGQLLRLLAGRVVGFVQVQHRLHIFRIRRLGVRVPPGAQEFLWCGTQDAGYLVDEIEGPGLLAVPAAGDGGAIYAEAAREVALVQAGSSSLSTDVAGCNFSQCGAHAIDGRRAGAGSRDFAAVVGGICL